MSETVSEQTNGWVQSWSQIVIARKIHDSENLDISGFSELGFLRLRHAKFRDLQLLATYSKLL